MRNPETICAKNAPHPIPVELLKNTIPDSRIFSDCAIFFKALSDETRTKIIWALSKTELCVCDLSAVLDMTPSAISHQLSRLRKAKMVKTRKSGKEVFYSLDDDHIRAMLEAGMEHTKE